MVSIDTFVEVSRKYTQVAGRLISCERRIQERNIIAFVPEHDRHDGQRLILHLDQCSCRIGIKCFGSILVSSEERGSRELGSVAVRKCIRVESKAVELLVKLGKLIENNRHKITRSSVEHDDHYILSLGGQGKSRDIVLDLLKIFLVCIIDGDHVVDTKAQAYNC